MELDSPRGWRSSAGPAGETGLRPLDWPGLCAHLAAARQLRSVLAQARTAGRSGSFDPAVARRMAGAGNGVRVVNLAASEGGNAAGDKGAAAETTTSD